MMLAGKDSSTQKVAKLRACIATRDEYSFANGPVFVPRYCHTMRCILAVETNYLGHRPGPDMFQTDEANARHRETVLQFWPEASGYLTLHYFRVDTKVRQDASADGPLNDRKSHELLERQFTADHAGPLQ